MFVFLLDNTPSSCLACIKSCVHFIPSLVLLKYTPFFAYVCYEAQKWMFLAHNLLPNQSYYGKILLLLKWLLFPEHSSSGAKPLEKVILVKLLRQSNTKLLNNHATIDENSDIWKASTDTLQRLGVNQQARPEDDTRDAREIRLSDPTIMSQVCNIQYRPRIQNTNLETTSEPVAQVRVQSRHGPVSKAKIDPVRSSGFQYPRDPDTYVLQCRSAESWEAHDSFTISQNQIDLIQFGKSHPAEDSIVIDQVVERDGD